MSKKTSKKASVAERTVPVTEAKAPVAESLKNTTDLVEDGRTRIEQLMSTDAGVQFPKAVSYLNHNFTLKGILEGCGVKAEDSVEEMVAKLTPLLEKAQKGLCDFNDLTTVCGWTPFDAIRPVMDREGNTLAEPKFTWLDFEGQIWYEENPPTRTELLKGYNDQLVNQINAILSWPEIKE